jgi:hypothetical protein
MATCQALIAMLPSIIHKRVLFLWCPHLLERNEVQINLEPPL